MRKITQQAVSSFWAGEHYRGANTTVEVTSDSIVMELHGNPIARRNRHSRGVDISLAGYPTNTTRERLRGVLDGLGQSIWCERGTWYVGTNDNASEIDTSHGVWTPVR